MPLQWPRSGRSAGGQPRSPATVSGLRPEPGQARLGPDRTWVSPASPDRRGWSYRDTACPQPEGVLQTGTKLDLQAPDPDGRLNPCDEPPSSPSTPAPPETGPPAPAGTGPALPLRTERSARPGGGSATPKDPRAGPAAGATYGGRAPAA